MTTRRILAATVVVTAIIGLAGASAAPAHRAAASAPRRSDRARLALRTTFGGPISPKSVASSGGGLVFAQNMMYRHTMTIYDSRRLRLVKTLSDTVSLSQLGFPHYRGVDRGAPVEAAFSRDGRYAYVSNYSMYGAGFGPEGTDTCSGPSGIDRSFVYRVQLAHLRIDRAYQVGQVPKVVAVTRDGRYVLVSNWCGYDVSVISVRQGRQVSTIPIGAYPRGIALTPDGDAAYVAEMGSDDLVRIDLHHWTTTRISVGAGPRAIVAGHGGRYLYVTLNSAGRVARLDLRTGAVISVATGTAPRSLAMSADGHALYVVNYQSGTVSKLRVPDLRVLQTVPACFHAIGITYDAPTRRVWVACYRGSILVYDDR